MKPTLVIFVKEPVPGRVKTRLGRDLGMTAAAQWFRKQSAALIRRLSNDPRWETVLAVSPDRQGLASRVWPAGIARWPQGRGNLGDRMVRALVAFGPESVAIVGADIPGIEPRHIARAFQTLRTSDAVFGPAPDGGYWLVGWCGSRVPHGFMCGVRWSSAHTLGDTIATLPKGARVGRLNVLRDVDTVADLTAYSVSR